MNIADILATHATRRPEHPAIEDGARIVDYRALDLEVARVAANLQAAGIASGDIVAVMLPDSADHLILLYALARAGAVVLSLDTNLNADEISRRLGGFAIKAAIARQRRSRLGGVRYLGIEALFGATTAAFRAPEIDDGHPLLVVQSSGTTGQPKSVYRSHGETIRWVERYAREQDWISAERCLTLTLLSLHTGRNTCLGMLYIGATVVIERSLKFDDLAALVRDKRISHLKMTAAHASALVDQATGDTPLFPDLRAMCIGNAPTTPTRRRLIRERLAPTLLETFGCNEVGLLSMSWPADQDAHPESVGRLVREIEAQIVDADDRPLPTGEVGFVRFRGPDMPSAYLDDAEASARTFRDGWFYPGDLAMLNDAGYLFFKGRADDVVNNAGAKFYPHEVENALLVHPAVAGAAVFGWPHDQAGEVAVACVVASAEVTEHQLRSFCAKRIARYKVPLRIQFLPRLPKNPMGKVLKDELKRTFARDLAERRRSQG